MEKNRRAYFSQISKYRAAMMGLAILMIMFCHLDVAQTHNGGETTKLARYLQTFTVGVDIFLLLSGFGLYYSYTKKRGSYFAFERKRISRVLPMYLLIGGTTYLIYDILIAHLSVKIFIKDITFLSWYFSGSTRYWYILAIIIFYLLFPLIYRLISGGKIPLLLTAVFCICWWFVVETFSLNYGMVYLFRIALSRLPVFILGAYFGRLSYEKKAIPGVAAALTGLTGYVALVVLKRFTPYPLYAYLYYPVRACLGVSLVITAIAVLEFLSKKAPSLQSRILQVLEWFGGLTLELYLLHQSYLILLDYPAGLFSYCFAAFILPTLTAAIIFLVRKKRRKVKAAV